jgi:hypothetical protein
MTTEMIAELAQVYGGAGAGTANQLSPSYSFSLGDIARFEAAYMGTAGTQVTGATPAQGSPLVSMMDSAGMRALLHPLERINLDAQTLTKGTNFSALTPGDMIMLTVRSHEFLFHCELTSNVANRTSDGIQQLFRQQS